MGRYTVDHAVGIGERLMAALAVDLRDNWPRFFGGESYVK